MAILKAVRGLKYLSKLGAEDVFSGRGGGLVGLGDADAVTVVSGGMPVDSFERCCRDENGVGS